jgi:hypothetical protein
MSTVAQNMKTGHDAPGTAENESGSAKHEKGPDAHSNAENMSGSGKYENGTRCPPYRRKRVRERKKRKRDLTPSVPPKMIPGTQNMKTGPDAHGIAENMKMGPR